jgi:hypothetical protein
VVLKDYVWDIVVAMGFIRFIELIVNYLDEVNLVRNDREGRQLDIKTESPFFFFFLVE